MKILSNILLLLCCFTVAGAQNLPEFKEKPSFVEGKTGKLIELEKSQYTPMAKAKGLFKAEGGFVLNGASSPVSILGQKELKFVVRVADGIDPTSIFDLAKFTIRGNQRIFITTVAKATSTTTSLEKIPFEVKKIKNEYHYLIVKELQSGEYFFGSKEFMFAFAIK